MKYTKLLGIAVSLSASMLWADQLELATIDRQAVVAQQQRIEKIFQRNQLERKAFVAVIAGLGIGLVYALTKGSSGAAPVQFVSEKIVLDPVPFEHKTTQEMLIEISAYTQRIMAQHANIEKAFAPLPWYKGLSKWVTEQSGMIILSQIIVGALGPFGKYLNKLDESFDGLVSRVYCTPNLNWFITTQQDIKLALRQLSVDAALVDGDEQHIQFALAQHQESAAWISPIEKNKQEDVQYYQNNFAYSWALCVHQVEAVIAFMNLKAHQIAQEDQERARDMVEVANHLERITDACAYQAGGQTTSLYDVITAYRKDLEIAFLRYATIESIR